ncbi:MAG TPA: hypothetical protein VI278_12110 [Nitrososphaeraceae archaeon]|jgi:uncharacterized C2H2 Zn-finger protein
MSTIKEDKKNDEYGGTYKVDLPKPTADFQCFVCGAIFTTDQDRRQHLEKEAHGELHEDTTPEEMEIAKEQEDMNESRPHHV